MPSFSLSAVLFSGLFSIPRQVSILLLYCTIACRQGAFSRMRNKRA